MPEAALVINCGPIEHVHGNGLSGMFHIPAKPQDSPFGLLVVYPTPEIQDIGDHRKTVHWLKAHPLGMAIVGINSDAKRERFGVLLCQAEPDLPKELLKALEAEQEFLTEHPPEIRYIRKGNLMEATNVESAEVRKKKIALSAEIVKQRDRFHNYCRTLVTKEEIETANRNLIGELARLIAEGDMMWARPADQPNISDLHRLACRHMGQERPWSYTPQQLFDCPGCGSKLKANVITCGHCGAILDEPLEAYAKMTPKEKAQRLYPERYAEAPPALTPGGETPEKPRLGSPRR